LEELTRLEDTIVVPEELEDDMIQLPQPPHHARGLYDIPEREPVQLWGDAVEALWRVTMMCGRRGQCWDQLTSRMLVWRSIAGELRGETSEWVRREVVANLQK
jgi:nucleolar pre-ribosomal-associated protein 1